MFIKLSTSRFNSHYLLQVDPDPKSPHTPIQIPDDPNIETLEISRKSRIDYSTFPDLPNLKKLQLSTLTQQIPLNNTLQHLYISNLQTKDLNISHLSNLTFLGIRSGYHDFTINLDCHPDIYSISGDFNISSTMKSRKLISLTCNTFTPDYFPENLTWLACKSLKFDQRIDIANFQSLRIDNVDFSSFIFPKPDQKLKLVELRIKSCSCYCILYENFPRLSSLTILDNDNHDFDIDHPVLRLLEVANVNMLFLGSECNFNKLTVKCKDLKIYSMSNLAKLSLDVSNGFELKLGLYPNLLDLEVSENIKVVGDVSKLRKFRVIV